MFVSFMASHVKAGNWNVCETTTIRCKYLWFGSETVFLKTGIMFNSHNSRKRNILTFLFLPRTKRHQHVYNLDVSFMIDSKEREKQWTMKALSRNVDGIPFKALETTIHSKHVRNFTTIEQLLMSVLNFLNLLLSFTYSVLLCGNRFRSLP